MIDGSPSRLIMTKVFCKDCIHLHHNMFDYEMVSCEPELIIEDIDPVYGKVYTKKVVKGHPTVKNREYDCQFYTPTISKRFSNTIQKLKEKLSWKKS